MAATPETLFSRLDALGIRHATHRHPPLRTVADSVRLRGDAAGRPLQEPVPEDRKGGLWLVVMLEDRRLDLKALADRLARRAFPLPAPS